MSEDERLMIPGPVAVSPEVLAAMARPIVAPYGAEWAAIHAETVRIAKAVFQTAGDLFIAVGSGSAGLEACLCQLAGLGGTMLIPTNGVFGKHLVKIARAYTDRAVEVELPDREPIAAETLERLLDEHDDVRSVAVVHCETHTGLLNPVREYGAVVRDRGALLLIDAISSVGGVELEMDAWGIDLCVTASQKALGAPPGLCLVAVDPRCWERFEKASGGPGWYLNLNAWRQRARDWADWHPSLTTMAVGNFLALAEALERVLSEGLAERFARHRSVSSLIREGLKSLGLEIYAPDRHASPTVTTAILPGNGRGEVFREQVRRLHRIVLAGASIPCGEHAFRVGHMAEQATRTHALGLLAAAEDALRAMGYDTCLDEHFRTEEAMPADG